MKRIAVVAGLVLALAGLGGASGTLLAPQGLAAEWKFSEGSGTGAADSSGNGVSGTLLNGAAWAPGRVGTGVSFDGANDHVSLGTNVNLVSNVPAATVALWINPASTMASGFRELISISVASAGATNTSRVALSLQGDGTAGDIFAGARSTDAESQKTVTANTSLAAGTWHHVTGVYDFAGNTIKVYLNGVLVATNAAAGFSAAATPNTPSRSLSLGAQDSGDSNYYHGRMDEVRVYRRALTALEIQALASADQLQARFSLDEGAGVTAADASENGLTGTLMNGTAWTAGMTGNALRFDGTNDWVDLGSNLPLLRNVNAATVSAWVRPGSTIPAGTFRELVSISVNSGAPTNTSRLALALQGDGTGGDLFVGGRSTDTESQKTLVGNANLAPGTWSHVTGVLDFSAGTISIYLNGSLLSTGPAAFTQGLTPNTPATNGALGAQDKGDSNFFQGDLDDVRIYGRALTACEVADLAMKDGLHLHLKLDEGTGTTTADASGHGTTGTLMNGVAWTTGQFGNGLSFDGANDSVDLGPDLDALSGANGATLSAWVKLSGLPGSGAFQDVISISVNNPGGPTNTSRAVLSLRGDGAAADLFAGGRSTETEAQQTIVGDANLGAGTWHHVAAVIDFSRNLLAVYKDGALVATQAVAFAQPTTPATDSTSSALGAQDRGDGNFFNGLMDEVRVYCRALSASEIAALAAPAVPAAPALLQASPGDGRVDLSWTSVAGATSYNVKRALASAGPYTTIANVGTTSYADLTVVNGTTYFYKVSALNLAGEGPDSNTLSATPQAPATLPAPVIVSPSGAINTTQPTVTGTSSATGLTITLFVDGTANGTTTSAVAGNWSIVPSTPLSEGTHSLTAQASNGTSTSALSAAVSVTVDTQPPVISGPNPASGATVFIATPTISASWSDSGTGLNLGTAVITLDGVTVTGASLTSTGFSFTPSPLAQGSHAVSAQIQDSAQNTTVFSWSFSVLLPPPSPTITSPAANSLLATGTPTISGTSSTNGLTITLLVDGAPRGTTVSGAGGAWSLTPSPAIGEGAHTLTATATNAAGTSAPSTAVPITVDTLAPVISNPVPPNGSSVFTTMPTVQALWADSGSGLNLATAQIFLDGVQVTNATLTPTDFSFTPTLAAGLHTVSAEIRDVAGNVGTLSWSFTVLLAPPAPAITSPANGAILVTSQPTVSGTSSASGLTITLLVDNVANGTTVSGTNGAWSLTPATPIPDGIRTLRATAANAVGTSAPSAPVSVTLDTQPPVISNPFPASGSTVTVAQVTISASWSDVTTGINLGNALITLDGAPAPNLSLNAAGFSFPSGPLTNAVHTVAVQVTDGAGHPGSFSWSFTVAVPTPDTIFPVITNLIPADGSLVSTRRPNFSASVSDQGGSGLSSVVLKIDGGTVGATVTFQNANNATVTFTPTSDLAETAHTVEVVARDGATNETTLLHSFTIDATAPAVTVSVTPPDPQTAAKTITATFSDPRLVESTRRVLIDLTDRTGDGVFTGNTWTLAATFSVASHSVVAQAFDEANNLGQATANFTVAPPPAADTRPPTVSIEYPTPSMSMPAGSTIHVVVLAKDIEANDSGIATVELLRDGVVQATKTGAEAQASFYYTFVLTMPNTPLTNVQLTARARDQEDNEATTAPQSVFLGNVIGQARRIQVAAPAVVTVGDTFNVTGTLLDAGGNPVFGDTGLRFRSNLNSTPITVFIQGTQATTPFVINETGVGVVEVVDVFETGAIGTSIIQVNAGPPANVEVEFFREERLSPGKSLSEVQATVTDVGGNPVANATVTWTMEFFQGGTSLGQQTFTATTNASGVAQIPAVVVPENSTQVNAGASVPSGGGTASGSASSPVVPNVVFNITFEHQVIQAGMPVSFTITAVNPETGEIATNFTGTVHVYRYTKHVHGAVTDQDGATLSDGEKITVTFTEDDRGVKYVRDGIILTERGETVLAASTEAPQWEFIADLEAFEWGENGDPFVTIQIQELTDAPSTIGGYSNEIVVLPGRPAHFVSVSLDVTPIVSRTILVDRFDNAVFLEPVEFAFEINDGEPTTYINATDVAGMATGFGPTNLDSSIDNTIKVTVKAPRYPAENPDGSTNDDGVPEVDTTRFLGKHTQQTGGEFITATSPEVIELGQPDQPVSDLTLRKIGMTISETVTRSFEIFLVNEQVDGIKFKAGAFTSGDTELVGALDVQDTSIIGVVRNITPIPIPLDANGIPIPQPFELNFTIQGILVDVPDDGRIPARHSDGRLQAMTTDSIESRTVAYFGKTLNFIGSVVASGNDDLADADGNKPAGVYIVDAEEVRRTMIINPGLIPQNPSTHIAGTFRIQVMDKDLTPSEDLKIKLESVGEDGEPILDPVTGETLEGTEVFVPLKAESTRDASDPDSTFSNSLVTLPIVATDHAFKAEESIGTRSGKVILRSQAFVPADGQTEARIDIHISFEDGTPAPGATVNLEEDTPKLPQAPDITQPEPTDGGGRATAYVKSTVPGTLKLKATVTVPSADAEHPGFSEADVPLRVHFFDDVRTIIVVPGGKVKATLYDGNEIASGFSDKVKEAIALGVTIEIKPEGEGDYRPAGFAVLKGKAPRVRFKFTPTLKAFTIPEAEEDTRTLHEPKYRVAVVVDDGRDATSVERGEDSSKRIIDPSVSTDFQKDTDGNTLDWNVSLGSTPFAVGANRIRVVFLQTALFAVPSEQEIVGTGPATRSARMLIYEDEEEPVYSFGLEAEKFASGVSFSASGQMTRIAPDHVRDQIVLELDKTLSDSEASEFLAKFRIIPVGYIGEYKHVLGDVSFHSGLEPAVSRAPDVVSLLRSQSDTALLGVSENLMVNLEAFDVAGSDPKLQRVFQGDVLNAKQYQYNWPNFVMQTYPAHRFIDKITAARGSPASLPVLGIVDTGVGAPAADRTTAPNADLPDSMFVAQGVVGKAYRSMDTRLFGMLANNANLSDVREVDYPRCEPPPAPGPGPRVPDGVFNDRDLHGEFVTQAAAGRGSAAVGLVGIGKDVNVTFFQFNPSANSFGFEALIQQAARDPNVMVINISFGTAGDIPQASDIVGGLIKVHHPCSTWRGTELANVQAVLRSGNISRKVSQSRTVHGPLKKAAENGKIILFASGNEGIDLNFGAYASYSPPAGLRSRLAREAAGNDADGDGVVNDFPDMVMAVGATGLSPGPIVRETFENFSNRGRKLSVVAPGSNRSYHGVVSDSVEARGTSFASPTVAGLAAELIHFENVVNQRVLAGAEVLDRNFRIIQIIEATADDLSVHIVAPPPSADEVSEGAALAEVVSLDGWDRYTGFGRINAWKAALAVANGGISQEDDRAVRVQTETTAAKTCNPVGYSDPAITGILSINVVQSVNPSATAAPIADPFPGLPRKTEAQTGWYGLQIANRIPGTSVSIVSGAAVDDDVVPPGDVLQDGGAALIEYPARNGTLAPVAAGDAAAARRIRYATVAAEILRPQGGQGRLLNTVSTAVDPLAQVGGAVIPVVNFSHRVALDLPLLRSNPADVKGVQFSNFVFAVNPAGMTKKIENGTAPNTQKMTLTVRTIDDEAIATAYRITSAANNLVGPGGLTNLLTGNVNNGVIEVVFNTSETPDNATVNVKLTYSQGKEVLFSTVRIK